MKKSFQQMTQLVRRSVGRDSSTRTNSTEVTGNSGDRAANQNESAGAVIAGVAG